MKWFVPIGKLQGLTVNLASLASFSVGKIGRKFPILLIVALNKALYLIEVRRDLC